MGFVYGFVYGVCVRDGRGREKRKEKREKRKEKREKRKEKREKRKEKRRQLRTKSEQNGLTRNKPPKNKR